MSGRQLFFEAPLPADMRHLGKCLGLLDEAGSVKTDGSVLTSRGDGAAELAAALGGVAQAISDLGQSAVSGLRLPQSPLRVDYVGLGFLPRWLRYLLFVTVIAIPCTILAYVVFLVDEMKREDASVKKID